MNLIFVIDNIIGERMFEGIVRYVPDYEAHLGVVARTQVSDPQFSQHAVNEFQ